MAQRHQRGRVHQRARRLAELEERHRQRIDGKAVVAALTPEAALRALRFADVSTRDMAAALAQLGKLTRPELQALAVVMADLLTRAYTGLGTTAADLLSHYGQTYTPGAQRWADSEEGQA